MINHRYVPEQCKGTENEPPTFSGHVVLRVPGLKERRNFQKMALRLRGSSLNSQELKDKLQNNTDAQVRAIDDIIEMIEASKAFYVSVELKFLEDGTEFKSYEEMDLDPRCETIMQEIAMELGSGIVPKKS